MPKTFAITGTEIVETGRISFKFMFDSDAPYNDFVDLADKWGVLLLKEKDNNHLDPFKLAGAWAENDHVEKQALMDDAIGPNGTLRWSLNIFDSNGLVLASGVDDDGLEKMLADIPDCVLLMDRMSFDRVSGMQTCQVHHYDGSLTTS